MAVLVRTLFRTAIALGVLALGLAPAYAIFGGKIVGNADPLGHALVAILYQDGTGAHLCTGVALAPRLVLTAAHCTDGDRSDIKIIFSPSLKDVGNAHLRGVAAVARAPRTDASKGTYAYNNPDDVALVLLDQPAPTGTKFATLAATLPSLDKLLTGGYGATSDFRKPNADGKRQLGFDGILRTVMLPVTATTGALIATDQTRGAAACTGDSGGPAFAAGDGLTVTGILIGVSSPRATNDYCRGTAHFAAIPRWKPWLEAAAAAFGQKLP